jgi:tRNA A-37 threonylcarbamoyl transferase component Bud32
LQDSITNLRTAFATKCYDEFSVVIDRLVAAVDEPLVKRSQELSKLCLGMIETGGQFKDIIAKHQADATTLFGNNLSAASRHGFSHSELTSSCLAHMNQELLKACASELSSASEKLAQVRELGFLFAC